MDAANNAAQPEPFYLTPEDTEQLHGVACRLVEEAANHSRPSIANYSLGRVAEFSLVGVFVTLRKNGDLRGCIGNFADAARLADALQRAAVGVVNHDPRFPPVTPDELAELTLTVSLLHTRELLDLNPRRRVEQVVIGQHGLDIQFQGHKGLLLPSVAIDFGLDPVGFLQAVCKKASLPVDAWQDSQATIYRFSAIVFGGPWVTGQQA